jgi:hypothetical protein
MVKHTMVKLQTYHRYVNYWNNYTDEVKLEMIVSIQKAATWAMLGFTETVKLYALYMKDGEKVYTNLAGFRKIMKTAKENKLNIPVKD